MNRLLGTVSICSAFSGSLVAETLNFPPPNVGKFRSCSFIEQCSNDTNCSTVVDCSHLPRTTENKCDQVWVNKRIALGIKTKIPQVKCYEVVSDAIKKCESEKAVQKSKCEERKLYEDRECRAGAVEQERQCETIREAEIAAAQDTLASMRKAMEYLSGLYAEEVRFEKKDLDILQFEETPVTIVKVVHSKNYGKFWSFLYAKKKYADWEKIPSLGYSDYRAFVVIDNYLVLPPDNSDRPTKQMIEYAALNAALTRQVGLDGMSQLYTHQPGYLEEFFVRVLPD